MRYTSWTHSKIVGFCQKLRYNYLHWIIRVRPPNIFYEGKRRECNYHTGKHSRETTGSYCAMGTGAGRRGNADSQLSDMSRTSVTKRSPAGQFPHSSTGEITQNGTAQVMQCLPSKKGIGLQDTSPSDYRIYKAFEGPRNRPGHSELHVEAQYA